MDVWYFVNVESQNSQKEGFLLPTHSDALLFWVKTTIFQARHAIRAPRFPQLNKTAFAGGALIAESRTPLRSSDEFAERELQSGKVQNLRVAAGFLNELRVPSGSVFSFWRQVPRPTRRFGFVEGRELREGCIVPSVGGGLCQLSNALYECALIAGWEIVERHGHSKKVPGSLAEVGQDATIFWNYVDLKFRAQVDWQLRVFLNRTELVVQIFAKEAGENSVKLDELDPVELPEVRSCETCGMTSCFRHPEKLDSKSNSNEFSVWAVDSFSPEFGDFVAKNHSPDDWLLTPLSSKRKYGAPRYPWPAGEFRRVIDFPGFTIHRSLVSRKLANQGAERQMANLKFNETLTDRMVPKLPHQSDHIVVSLELLPYFWKSGALGGRRFDVMMTRWPIRLIQQKLDAASKRWPESPTLADFRTDEALADLEWEALQEADSWITPHPEIAKLAPEGKVQLSGWKRTQNKKLRKKGKHIVFPATTAGRNGAYEVREAIRRLNLPLKIVGPVVEGADFWDGLHVSRLSPELWLEEAAVVVLPAWISTRPTRLLAAIEAGIPVLTTSETGLSDVSGVRTHPTGDVDQLVEALKSIQLEQAELSIIKH